MQLNVFGICEVKCLKCLDFHIALMPWVPECLSALQVPDCFTCSSARVPWVPKYPSNVFLLPFKYSLSTRMSSECPSSKKCLHHYWKWRPSWLNIALKKLLRIHILLSTYCWLLGYKIRYVNFVMFWKPNIMIEMIFKNFL